MKVLRRANDITELNGNDTNDIRFCYTLVDFLKTNNCYYEADFFYGNETGAKVRLRTNETAIKNLHKQIGKLLTKKRVK